MSGEAEPLSEFATVVRREMEVERPSAGSLEARASVALKLLAGINVAGVVLAMFSPLTPVSNLLAAMFNSAAAVLAVLYVVEARALDRRRPWAVTAVRPLLVVLAASGIYSVLAALTGGTVRVPFDGLLAIWALLGPADLTLGRRLVRQAALLVGAAAALLSAMALAQPIFGWGGLLDVHEADLQASIDVDCGEPGAGPPSMISVRYDWSWRSRSPLPSGTDIVVIGWTGDDGHGRPMYVIGEIPGSGAGIRAGLPADPSNTMARQILAESRGSYAWGVALDQQQLEPGRIEVQLMRARAAPSAPNPLRITVSYIHRGLWRHASASVTCSW